MTTRYAHIALPMESGTLHGFALCFPEREQAVDFFDFVHRYLTASGHRSRRIMVAFSTPNGGTQYRLELRIDLDDEFLESQIDGLKPDEVLPVVESLHQFKYYFVLAGTLTEAGRVDLLDPSEYHLFKADLMLDGKHVMAAEDAVWPIANPFTSKDS